MDKLFIETPEQIPLEFPVAGIGSRFLALAMDTFFQVVAGALAAAVVVTIGLKGFHAPTRSVWTVAVLVLLAFLLQFGYFAIFEAVWNGQTPGKRLMHLRVIQDSGRPITVYEAVARNLLRIVDSLPGLYGVAIVSALLSAKSKRLGDFVAGTVVVHEKAAVLETGVQWDSPASPPAAGYELAHLTADEFQLIEAFLLRRNQLAQNVRLEAAQRILRRVSARLKLTPENEQKPEQLLESLAVAHRARARFG
jgi:uncharacterized RDD family membrane protein YckC